MTRKKLLFISAFFPNPSAPNIATYNRQQLIGLSEYYDIDAVVPIPWTHKINHLDVPKDSILGAIRIKYPTYFYSPGILRNIYGYFYYYSIQKSVSELITNNTYDVIYSSWLYPDAWVAAKIARKLRLPLFVSVLGTDVNRIAENSFLSRMALKVADYASSIKCVSTPLRDKLASLGCVQNKLYVLQNGIDNNIFYPMDKNISRSELGISTNEKVILFVGNLKKEKGLGELCQAFSSLIKKYLLSDCRLIVIGAGAFRSTLESSLSEQSVLDKADILGERSLEVIAKYMNACDVLCLPSYSEGQPNVVMEALACQTRVVATNVGGIPDLDKGYGNLKMVPPQDADELTVALYEVLTDGKVCEQWIKFNSWSDNAAYLHELFESAKVEV